MVLPDTSLACTPRPSQPFHPYPVQFTIAGREGRSQAVVQFEDKGIAFSDVFFATRVAGTSSTLYIRLLFSGQLPRDAVITTRLTGRAQVGSQVVVSSVIGMDGSLIASAQNVTCSGTLNCSTGQPYKDIVLRRSGGSLLPSGQLIQMGVSVVTPRYSGPVPSASITITTANGVLLGHQEDIAVDDVLPAPADPSTSSIIYTNTTSLAPNTLVAGTVGLVLIRTRDRFNNVRTTSTAEGFVTVALSGAGPVVAGLSDLRNGLLEVDYAATCSGQYFLAVRFGGISMSASPFVVELVASNISPLNSNVEYTSGFASGVVGFDRGLTVRSRDSFGYIPFSSAVRCPVLT